MAFQVSTSFRVVFLGGRGRYPRSFGLATKAKGTTGMISLSTKVRAVSWY